MCTSSCASSDPALDRRDLSLLEGHGRAASRRNREGLRPRHGDHLAANRLGRALLAPLFDGPARGNIARFTFLDTSSGAFYPDREQGAHAIVAVLRGKAGRNPYDRQLSDLIGELSTRSDEFRVRWAAHNVRFHRTGTKRLHHPVEAAAPQVLPTAAGLYLPFHRYRTDEIQIQPFKCRIVGLKLTLRPDRSPLEVPDVHSQHSRLK